MKMKKACPMGSKEKQVKHEMKEKKLIKKLEKMHKDVKKRK